MHTDSYKDTLRNNVATILTADNEVFIWDFSAYTPNDTIKTKVVIDTDLAYQLTATVYKNQSKINISYLSIVPVCDVPEDQYLQWLDCILCEICNAVERCDFQKQVWTQPMRDIHQRFQRCCL